MPPGVCPATGTTHRMSGADLSGLNAGYVAQMLEAYLDAPASVSQEWRDLFERDPAAFTGSLPGLAGLLQRDGVNGATVAPARRPPRLLPPPAVAVAPPVAEPIAMPTPPPAPPAPAAAPSPARPPRLQPRPSRRATPSPLPSTRSSSAVSPRRWPSSRPTGCTGTSRPARPARLRADGRPRARRVPARPVPDARAAGTDPGRLASPLRRRDTLLEALPLLRAVYTGSIAYESSTSRSRRARVVRQASNRALPAAARPRRAPRRSSTASPRPRASSSTCGGRSSGRSSSRSRASSCSYRCSTRRSGSPPLAAHTRS